MSAFCVVLQDFCRLSLDFLRKGPSPKLYQTAARKYPEKVKRVVAITCIKEFCCKGRTQSKLTYFFINDQFGVIEWLFVKCNNLK